MVDLGTLTWFKATSTYTRFRAVVSGIERISAGTLVANMICSTYAVKSANQTYIGQTGISLQQNADDIYIYDHEKVDMTAAEFTSAMSGVQLCYKLATPITYQLTPQQVTTLLDTNNIWAITGDVTVTYPVEEKAGG